MMPRTGRKRKFGISSGIFLSRSFAPSLPAFFCYQEQLYLFCFTHVCLCYQNLRAFLLVEKSSRKLTALQNTLPFHDVLKTKLKIIQTDLKTTQNRSKSRVRIRIYGIYMRHCCYVYVNSCAKKWFPELFRRSLIRLPYTHYTHQFLIRTLQIADINIALPRSLSQICDLHCSICRSRPPLHEGTRMGLVLVFLHVVHFLCSEALN